MSKINLKKILKTIKLNENSISMVLGAIVILIVGSLVINYIRNNQGSIPEELLDDGTKTERQEKIHTVTDGETLWSIAQNYYDDGFGWAKIAEANNISSASKIEVGQEIIIPDQNQEDNLDIVADGEQSEAIKTATYEVVKGDNLWDIAVRAYGDGYKWVEIAKENNLVNPNLIHSGNILVLPR